MRIGYLFSNFHLANITGQPAIVLKLAQRAAERGERVFIVSNSTEDREFRKENIHFFLIKGLGDFKTYFFNFPKIIKYLRDIKPDVIHVHGHLLIIYTWFIGRFLGFPVVASLCEILDVISPFYRKILVFCLNRTEKTFVSSEHIRNQLLSNGLPAYKISVVRLGVDQKFFTKAKNVSPDTDILYFGDSNKERGFDIVFRLAQRLPNLKFKVLLRWEGKNCYGELEKMKKLPNVVIWNYPYAESLDKIISKSKLVILPFRWLGVRPPLSLLESMALGQCVITSSMKGNEEVVRNEYNGLVVNFNKLDNVAFRISLLVKDDNQRDRLGWQARKTILKMYSEDEYDKILNYYRDV